MLAARPTLRSLELKSYILDDSTNSPTRRFAPPSTIYPPGTQLSNLSVQIADQAHHLYLCLIGLPPSLTHLTISAFQHSSSNTSYIPDLISSIQQVAPQLSSLSIILPVCRPNEPQLQFTSRGLLDPVAVHLSILRQLRTPPYMFSNLTNSLGGLQNLRQLVLGEAEWVGRPEERFWSSELSDYLRHNGGVKSVQVHSSLRKGRWSTLARTVVRDSAGASGVHVTYAD